MNKTKIIKFISILLTIALIIPVSLNVSAQVNDTAVSIDQAKSAATSYLNIYSKNETSWVDASLSNSTVTYYSLNNNPNAYELTILDKNGISAGFIIMSATINWMPVLERGTGKAPSSYLEAAFSSVVERKIANAGDYGEPVIYYFGALAYYTQFGQNMIDTKQMIHLPTGVLTSKPETQPVLRMDPFEARAEWNKIYAANLQLAGFFPIRNFSSHKSNTIVTISGVPAWYQSVYAEANSDEGFDYETNYPDCVGNADDPWNHWDGCGPISGAMVLGYWSTHGYSSISYDDETLIDHSHHYMWTSDAGATENQNVGPGIEDLSQYYGYDFTTSTNYNPSWNDFTSPIDYGNPYVLQVQISSPHGVAVIGYDDSTPKQLKIHDTYDTSDHWITYGVWDWALVTTVTPGG